jgi:hypothetical protein
LRRLDLEIKGRESGWSSKYFTPLTTTLLAGILTLAGSVVGTIIQGRQTLQLEEGKFQSSRNLEKEKFEFTKEIEISKQQHELIVKMISVGDEKQARANIKFLAETGLIKDDALAKSLLAASSVGVLPAASLRGGNRSLPGSRLHALTIGISDYGGKASDLRLKFAERDARDVARVLVDTQDGGLYADIKLQSLSNERATRQQVFLAFSAMERSFNMDDLAVVMFSGHGTMIDGEFYFVLYGAESATSESIRATGISAQELRHLVDRLASRGRVLLLLDVCATKCESLPVSFGSSGVTVLASFNGTESEKWQHGYFTKVLLDALNGAADSDQNGIISTNELCDYMDRNLPILTNGEQHVGIVRTFSGELFLTPGSASIFPTPR